MLRRSTDAALSIPLAHALELLLLLNAVVSETHYLPCVALDGRVVCAAWNPSSSLHAKLIAFIDACRLVCLRPEGHPIMSFVDVSNLHRVREMAEGACAALGHVRHFSELSIESAHQPVKSAILGGNGHDDSCRAMQGLVQT